MMLSHIPDGDSHRLVSKGFLRLLAGLGGCVLAGAVLGWPGDAHAATQAAGSLTAMRQKLVPGNVQQCRSLLDRKPQLDPYAPKSASGWDGYCACVGQTYVSNMPDNVVLAFASGKLPQERGEQSARLRAAAVSLDAARARCASAR
ncbi:hypothetical protein [Bordetella sp. H567]|uniref:hypothetical protein n=1 Tax=Bordetella sp. H567 TaxID=1697043 RepID=UPI0011AB72A6|nr:hypothetical protein [Bordetella sp. H567]